MDGLTAGKIFEVEFLVITGQNKSEKTVWVGGLINMLINVVYLMNT